MFDTDLKPANKTAALVMSKGCEYNPDIKESSEIESKNPIETRPLTDSEKDNPVFHDLTGLRKGRLTVVGICATGKGGRWVVRCDCSMYAIRTRKSLQKKNNNVDRCKECRNLANIKKRDYYKRTGKDSCQSDF